jgi:hypothetical protein
VGTSTVWGGRPTAEEQPSQQPGCGGNDADPDAAAAAAFAAAYPSASAAAPPAVVVLDADDSGTSYSVARAGGAHGGGDGLTSFSAGAVGNRRKNSSPSILGARPKSAGAARQGCVGDGAAAVYIIQQGDGGGKGSLHPVVPAPAAAALLRRLGQRNAVCEDDDDPALPPIASVAPVFSVSSPPPRLGHRLAYRPDMFHLVYALAAMYLAMLFTNWEVASFVIAADFGASGAADFGGASGASLAAFQFGGGWASVWVKMATKWFCEALYLWTVLAPLVCGRCREFSSSSGGGGAG